MIEADFRPENNPKRKWYHMPWIHAGKHPRECIHGMTRERDLKACPLNPTGKSFQTWGYTFYNDYAGYTLGRIWSTEDDPQVDYASFPDGALIVKMLFTEAGKECPTLEGAETWQVHVEDPKEVRPLWLVQMDVAVRDSRSDNMSGWIYGVFVYDKNASGETPWHRMVPLGLTWGSDPGIIPKHVELGYQLKETIIFQEAPEYARKRLGRAGRLNGPVDNPKSSCFACHCTAQWKPQSAMVPSKDNLRNRWRWFRNLKVGEPFDKGEKSLDNCLQLQLAIINYFEAKEAGKTLDGFKEGLEP
jgi:hypothetical protein